MHKDSLAAGMVTKLVDCPPLCLGNIEHFSLTVRCTFSLDAAKGIRIHIRTSPDGIHYDTRDQATFDMEADEGQTAQNTFILDPSVRFIKILVRNLDDSEAITDLDLTAALGG